MADKKTGELESEIAQAQMDKGRWLNDKTRFENTWAENPNAPAVGPLAGVVGSDIQKLSLDEAAVIAREQEEKVRLMKKKPPEGGCDLSESSDSNDSSLNDSPLETTPFKNKPK